MCLRHWPGATMTLTERDLTHGENDRWRPSFLKLKVEAEIWSPDRRHTCEQWRPVPRRLPPGADRGELRFRLNFTQAARDRTIPVSQRALISDLSNSARPARTVSIRRPVG
jgi:hypothetical protein